MDSVPPPPVKGAASALALPLLDPDEEGSAAGAPGVFDFFFAIASGATAMVNANTRNRAQPFSRLMEGPHKVAPARRSLGGQLNDGTACNSDSLSPT